MTAYAIAAAVLLAIGFGGGWTTQSWRHDAAELSRSKAEARDKLMRIERVDQAAEKHEAFKAKEEVRYVETIKYVDRIVARPVYRDRQCWDSDGVRLVNDAIAGRSFASEPPAEVPRPEPAPKR